MADTTYPNLAIYQGAQQAQGLVVCKEVHFTEAAANSGAGSYTGSITVPAGAWLLNVAVQCLVVWDASGAVTGKVGDAADDDGYYTGIDMKATDLTANQTLSFAKTGGKEGAYFAGSATHTNLMYSASERVISLVIVMAGASGSAGRTRFIVEYAIPSPSTAATFA